MSVVGVITTRDVLAHPVLIVAEFGWAVFFRALRASFSAEPTTFACVYAEGAR